jgi:hypothetical protein
MNRRGFLIGAAATPAGRLWRRAAASPAATTPRLCIAEYWPFLNQPATRIQKRLDLYRQLGFGTLRTAVDWWLLQGPDRGWHDPPFLRNYLKQVIASGFRLKLTLGTLGAPAGWYLRAHPDARIRNAAGKYATNDMSLWYPGLRALLSEKADKLTDYLANLGIFGAIDFIFVDLGPASEPLYPPPLTTPFRTHGPWFYDEHAEAAFARAMRRKHRTLGEANRIWGTAFGAWGEVRLPRLGEHPGQLWLDALLWYRNSKRRFVRWQVANYRRALNRHDPPARHVKLIILVPGLHISPEEWAQSAWAANPDYNLTIMSDSEFLLDLAQRTGSWLQYTGVDGGKEVAYLRRYMEKRGVNQPMWGENVQSVARNPEHIADVILANKLYGLDYVNSSYVFGSDSVTPNDTYQELATACQRLRRALG